MSDVTIYTSTYFQRNNLRSNSAIPSPSLRAFGEITAPGFFVDFTLSTITKQVVPQVFAMSFANPAAAPAITNAYHQMHFTLVTVLPVKYGPNARRWQLEIKESATGVSPTTVYTASHYEMPDTRYRMQVEGATVAFYRNHSGPGSVEIYRSIFPVTFPMILESTVTTKASFLNVVAGGRPDYVVNYPAEDQIADSGGSSPPPEQFRYRVYEIREHHGVTYLGDATDFIA